MCPYMIRNADELPVCEPREELCTFCVIGNEKTYKEIQQEESEEPV